MARKNSSWIATSTREVAKFFGVGERRVQQWIGEGMPRVSAGRRKYAYHLDKIAQWRLKHKDSGGRPKKTVADLSPIEELEYRKRLLDVMEREGRVLDREQVKAEFSKYVLDCSLQLDAIPDQIAILLGDLPQRDVAIADVRKTVNGVRRTLARIKQIPEKV